jgi:O-acetylhomoserine (thiol)-lyase
MSDQHSFGFETRAIHAGASPDPATGARSTPIYQTTAFVFEDADDAASLFNLQKAGFIYSRLTNPTVSVLEERIASLENGVGTTCTSSGHAAQLLALSALLKPGERFIASKRLYGGSLNQFANFFPRSFGWHCDFFDFDDLEGLKKLVTPEHKLIFCESLANPGGVITDLEAIAKVAEANNMPLLVDNTMASPYLCRPIDYGATLVLHSTTKFLSGHGNAMGGAVVDSGTFDWSASGRYPALSEPEPGYHGLRFHETFGNLAFTIWGHAVGLRDLGPSQQPLGAFLTMTGIETLPLRMERHCENALKVAQFLEQHRHVEWVNYAGLPSNPYYHLAKKYLPKGAGSVFTFGLKGGYAAGVKLCETVELFSHLANIGDTRSLIIHPASTTHRQLDEAGLKAAGATPDVVRLSIGIETADDLIADLDRSLEIAMNAASQAAE